MKINPFSLIHSAMTFKQKLAVYGSIFVAILIALGSAYFVGYSKGKHISKDVISGYELKVSQLQADVNKGQSTINERVNTVYVDRYHTIQQTTEHNDDVIVNNVTSRPDTVTTGWIYAHNQSALGLEIDPLQAANNIESGVTDTTILRTINTNYGASNQCIAQVAAWNDWYSSTKKMYDDYSANRKAVMEKNK